MSRPTIFPNPPQPSSINRHFQYLPTHPLTSPSAKLPTSSFHRSGTIRSSLKKIPSLLFSKEKPAKPKSKFQIFADEPRNGQASTGTDLTSNSVTPERRKLVKPKGRKALADIFHWGNNSPNTSTNVIAAKPHPAPPALGSTRVQAAPTPPPKDKDPLPTRKVAHPLMKKPSQSGLTGWTPLKPPTASPPKVSRPSMGEDPFKRGGEGAQMVETVTRHGSQSSSARSVLVRRRETASPGGFQPQAVVHKQEVKCNRDVNPSTLLSFNPKIAEQIYQPSTTSMRRIPPLRAPPPTCPSPFLPPTVPLTTHGEGDLLKKNKTKSRVWGLLGLKTKKSRDVLPAVHPAVILSPQSSAEPSLGPSVPRRVSFINALKEASANLPNAEKRSHSGSTLPRPPVVHVTQPSLDIKSSSSTSSPRPKLSSVVHAEPVVPKSPGTHRDDFEDFFIVPSQSFSHRQFDDPRQTLMGMPNCPGVLAPETDTKTSRRSTNRHSGGSGGTMVSRGLPKRKCLTGLFGALHSTGEHSRLPVAGDDEVESTPPESTGSLAEEMQAAVAVVVAEADQALHGDPGNDRTKSDAIQQTLRRVASATDKLLSLVSHFNFSPAGTVSPSPRPSPRPHTVEIMESPASITSTVLQEVHGSSPTPMRRIKSAMLASKSSTITLKQGSPQVSPLRLALHQAQVAAHQRISPTGSPLKKITASAGTQDAKVSQKRNVFAPPSPQLTATLQPPISPAVHPDIETVGMPRPLSTVTSVPPQPPRAAPTHLFNADLPDDLRDLFIDMVDFGEPSIPLPPPSIRRIPVPPFAGRRPSRRDLRAAVPPGPTASSVQPVPSPSINLSQVHDFSAFEVEVPRTSLFSEGRDAEHRNSFDFDFTNEYAQLDLGEERASFMEPVQMLAEGDMPLGEIGFDMPPLPPLPSRPSMSIKEEDEVEGQFADVDDEQLDEKEDSSATFGNPSIRSNEITLARNRPSPFTGQLAFQQHAAKTRASHSPKTVCESPLVPLSPSPLNSTSYGAAELLPLPPAQRHHRDESGLSIATMSSVGGVIETDIAGEYTNYFDVEFARDNERRASAISSVDKVSDILGGHSARSSMSRDSLSGPVDRKRAPTRRTHHRRNSSISSLDSVDLIDVQLGVNGPPISMHNLRRSSYISKHRRSLSGETAYNHNYNLNAGRSDCAAHHRRNSSTDSATSTVSAGRIARPGLGERMFQLDGGVQLTSITGSPAVIPPDDRCASPTPSGSTYKDSILDGPTYDALGRDSIFDSSCATGDTSLDADSIFGTDESVLAIKKEGGIRQFCLRPVSEISTATSSSEDADDTFMNVNKWKKEVTCLEADGEDNTMILSHTFSQSTGRQLLSSSISRPAKPGVNRRAPSARLVLDTPSMDTPGLTSPSASETSSRFSLDTRHSEGPIFGPNGRVRPMGAGHHRQKSSAGVIPQATIKEEPSIATIRPNRCSDSSSVKYRESEIEMINWETGEVDAGDQAMKGWLQWKREADDEYRRTKREWQDSEESKMAVEDWKMPTTAEEIAQFLANSSAAFKPLDQLPIGRRQAHRRKSSLSNSRLNLSPYGFPLPKPPQTSSNLTIDTSAITNTEISKPRISLITKFERTNSSNSATSSHFSYNSISNPNAEGTPASPTAIQPPSAIFAKFARERPPSPLPTLSKLPPMSPFKLDIPSERQSQTQRDQKPLSLKEHGQEQSRVRLSSDARRQALGWGRRGYSDGPGKIGIMMVPPVPKVPAGLAPKKANGGMRSPHGLISGRSEKENVVMPVQNSCGKVPKSPARRGRKVTKLASMPKGLRV